MKMLQISFIDHDKKFSNIIFGKLDTGQAETQMLFCYLLQIMDLKL